MADQDMYDVSPDDALEESRHSSSPYRYYISRKGPHEDDDTDTNADDGLDDGADDDPDERPWHLVIFNEKDDDS